jgi:hypothetical protein
MPLPGHMTHPGLAGGLLESRSAKFLVNLGIRLAPEYSARIQDPPTSIIATMQ